MEAAIFGYTSFRKIMIKPLFYCLLIFASFSSVQAFAQKQPTYEEIQALLDKSKRMADSIGKIQQKKLTGSTPEVKHIPLSLSKTDTVSFRPPPRNAGMLAALPKQKLSTDELKSFISSVDKKLTTILTNEGVQLPAVE